MRVATSFAFRFISNVRFDTSFHVLESRKSLTFRLWRVEYSLFFFFLICSYDYDESIVLLQSYFLNYKYQEPISSITLMYQYVLNIYIYYQLAHINSSYFPNLDYNFTECIKVFASCMVVVPSYVDLYHHLHVTFKSLVPICCCQSENVNFLCFPFLEENT